MVPNEPLDPRVQQILDDEILRARLAGSLNPPKKSWLSDNTKWLLATIAIPFTTYLVGQFQERVAKVEARSRERIAMQDRKLERVLGDARNNVSAMTALLPALSDTNPDRSSLALIVLKQLEKAQYSQDTKLTEVVTAVQKRIDQLRNSSDQAQREEAARQQEALSEATGPASTTVDRRKQTSTPAAAAVESAPANKPRIVYIQIYENLQRGDAAAVQQLLRADGVGAPGIELIAVKSGARIGVRPPRIFYFNDSDLGGAKWLQQRLAEKNFGNWTIQQSKIAGVPLGQIELWWPHKAVSGS